MTRPAAWFAPAALALALAATPILAPQAQEGGRIGAPATGRTGIQMEASEALASTVRLVLRTVYRRDPGSLPDYMLAPRPMAPEIAEALAVRARLPEPLRDRPAPLELNRRLPHSRGGSVWAVGGRDMIEVDPVRLTVLAIVRDALPVDFDEGSTGEEDDGGS